MKLGLSSYTYTWGVGVPGHPPDRPLSALMLVHRAIELGVPLVQFADNLPLHQLTAADVAAIESDARDAGLEIEVGTRGIGEHLHRYLQLANVFGSPFVRIVLDAGRDQPSPSEAAERLKAFEPAFRQARVRLAIENHDRFTTTQLVGLVEALGDWVGICLDTVNSLGSMETPRAVVAALGPHAINLHLKDFTIRRHSHQMGFEIEGTPAGSGLLDIPWLLEALSSNADLRSAILELWTPPESTIEATIAKEVEWANTSLAYLRGIPTLEFTK